MGGPTLRDLELLTALFRQGEWREVRVEWPEGRVLLSQDSTSGAASPAPLSGALAAPRPAPEERRSSPTADEPVQAGWAAVQAPNLGTFYRSPKPGAAPFVEIGDRISAETEICLLEVMKLFTSVKAGTAGIVRRICVEDGELVESGRPLFYIESE